MGISFQYPLALLALLAPLAWWAWRIYQRRLRGPAGKGRLWFLKLRPTPSEWMRLLVVLLLTLALAGTGIRYSARYQAVMFIADLSTSTGSVRSQMEEFVKQAIAEMRPGDRAGVLAVAEDAQLEAPVTEKPLFSGFTAVVRPDHTDLERGLRLGAALLPAGYRPRLVLLSDGRENVGNAMAEVQRLRQRGLTVDVVNISPTPGAEALIKSVEAPGSLRLGERLDVSLTLTSTGATSATLRIYEERTLLESRHLELKAGDQQVRLSMEGLKPGYHRIWAVLEADRDTLTQNNESAVMVNIQGAPSILVVEGFAGAATNLRRALESTGMTVEVRSPDGLPTHGTQLARYASVVLVDLPAPFIRPATMDALAGYVQQSGHGLVVVGGENSYAMGGYAGTKLEEIMPVSMDVPQRKEKPPVAVALIIENFESQAKINLSKEAGKALIDLLTPRDMILVGDATIVGSWSVPPTRVEDKAKIKAQIDAMAPGDPPSYMEHLEAAAAELRKIDAKIKHIVLAGDGDAQGIGFNEYASRVARLAADGITLSTVHVNWQRPGEELLMQLIAQMGKGRYYLAADAGATPQIFMQEAKAMARPGVVEEDFIPAILSRSPILQGASDLPVLRGYVATTPKSTGEVVLQSAQSDPVLATWQTGLGRVAAFTSDSGGLWSEQMVRWESFNRFWANVVSWTMPSVDASGIRTSTAVAGGKARLTVQLPGEGLEVGGVGGANSWPATLTAGIILPDGSTRVQPLQATAPGQYEAEIEASMAGPYLVRLSAGTRLQSVLLGETFLLVPYSPEFAVGSGDPGFMGRLARSGGGRELSDPTEAFATNLPSYPGRLPLDRALLILGLLLWPLDIALRRLSVTPADLAQALRRRRERGATAAPATTTAALERLRARRSDRGSSDRSVPIPPAPPRNAADRPAKAAPAAPSAPSEPAGADSGATEGQDFTQRLLAARRKRK